MSHPANLQPPRSLPRRWERLLSVEMGKEGAGNEIKMGLICTSNTARLGNPHRSTLPGREGCSGETEAKCKFFFPNTPKSVRKYLSSQKILIHAENACPSSALATGLGHSSLAKPSHGSTTWIIWSQPHPGAVSPSTARPGGKRGQLVGIQG